MKGHHQGAIVAVLCTAAGALAGTTAAVAHDGGGGPEGGGLNHQDRTFLKGAKEGALFEVQGGSVAVSNAARPGVRSFGQQMISDHGREVKEADRVARKVHLRLPDAPSAEQQKVVWIFSQFTGPAFDCVYISNEYNDHQADIAEAELELANGHNATVKAFARRWLKVYKQHDHMASDLLLGTQSCH